MDSVVFGQFFPSNSFIHKLDPRIKILVLTLLMLSIFLVNSFFAVLIIFCGILSCIFISKVPLKIYFKSIKGILFFVGLTAILNLFYGSGMPVFEFYFLKITLNGIQNSVLVASRIINLILASSILTFSTSPTALTDAIEEFLKPLKLFKIDANEIAMMISIALRFVPTLLEESKKIMQAQKARGANFENKNLKKRIKSMIPIVVPLFISAFRSAYDLALAMECRCYNGGAGRTKMNILKFSNKDFLVLVICVLFFSLILYINFHKILNF